MITTLEQSPIRRFEKSVLQPLWLAMLGLTVFASFHRYWWSIGLAVVAMFSLGTIGSGLHPLMTGTQLREGPTESPRAKGEAIVLPLDAQLALVGRASTQVSMLLILVLSWISLAILGWRWYAALPASWILAITLGGVLKFLFTRRPNEEL